MCTYAHHLQFVTNRSCIIRPFKISALTFVLQCTSIRTISSNSVHCNLSMASFSYNGHFVHLRWFVIVLCWPHLRSPSLCALILVLVADNIIVWTGTQRCLQSVWLAKRSKCRIKFTSKRRSQYSNAMTTKLHHVQCRHRNDIVLATHGVDGRKCVRSVLWQNITEWSRSLLYVQKTYRQCSAVEHCWQRQTAKCPIWIMNHDCNESALHIFKSLSAIINLFFF